MKTAPTALERRSTRPTRPTRPSGPDGTSSQPDGQPEAPDTDHGEKGDRGERQPRRYKEVWLVEDRREGKSIWTRVGVAFENADSSWNIRLSALPVGSGRLNMRDPVEREGQGTQRVAA